jgi:glycosyltransferase involved in cell wall biosynthesis
MNSASPGKETRYVIITPVRDEARHIGETVKSVVQQTIQPIQWVIIDDGSTDGTGEIIDHSSVQWPWITPLHQPNRGFRDADTGAIRAFLTAYRSLKSTDWEFLVNLDGDLSLETQYFERCFEEFEKDPRLGIGGGLLYHLKGSSGIEVEPSPEFHVRGATKIYRRACWDAIGGLADVPGWDTFDEVKAHMTGWRVRTFLDIRVLHRRPTGQAAGNWRDAIKNGRSDYFLGYNPLFMLLKCLRRAFKRPYIVNGLGHLCGFLGGYSNRRPQVADKALISYVRRQQLRRLLFLESTWK